MIKKLLTTNHTEPLIHSRTNIIYKILVQRVRDVRVVRGKILLFSFLFFISSFIYAQTGISLDTEIQNLESLVARQGVSAQERHAGLVRLATLRQLSGDIENAARNWLDAASAIPGRVDDDALLNCAYCLAAMGEWDRARTALEPLLSKSVQARFLNTSINAISQNRTAGLAALADNPEYASIRTEIYFLLWRLSSGAEKERWRLLLIREFPQSPEALFASGGTLETGQTISLRLNPFWLFIGGLDSLPLLASETGSRPIPSQDTTPVPPVVQPPVAEPSYVRLQTGIYSQYANAQTQVQRLRQAGFNPTIEERTIGETQMWAVTVPVEQEQALRTAGIEFFHLR